MRRIHQLLIVALVIMISTSFVHAQEQDDRIAEIDSYLNNLVAYDAFSGSVLIAQGDTVLLSKGYGLANREWEIPNTPDTKFRITSVTKQFTGMAILLLQEQGLLSVEDLVCDYIDDCPNAWQDITLYHLLTHTSGIPDVYNFPDYFFTLSIPKTPHEIIDVFIDAPLDFEPGSQWFYSNAAYIVLGEVIAQVSGQDYETFLQDNFFGPLNMVNSGYENNDAVLSKRAEGYIDAQTKGEYTHMSTAHSAGALYSTVEDMFIWIRALNNGQVVSQETLEAMWDAAYQTNETRLDGYGMVKTVWNGHPFVGKGGAMSGFVSITNYFIDDETTLIVLSNMDIDYYGVREAILAMLFDGG